MSIRSCVRLQNAIFGGWLKGEREIVCRFFYLFFIIFQLFFNQNGANSLASLYEKNDL